MTQSIPQTLPDDQIDKLVREHLGGMRPGSMLLYRNLIRAALSQPMGVAGIPEGWQPIETAPKDGTRILAWSEEYGARETRMNFYGEGSPGYADWKAGRGPRESGWDWSEPKNNWGFSWKPTHWMPLLATPSIGPSTQGVDQ